MKFSKVIRGIEVDITAHDYEFGPDENVCGYSYVTAEDMDGKPFNLTDEEQEQLCIEAGNEPPYFDEDEWEAYD